MMNSPLMRFMGIVLMAIAVTHAGMQDASAADNKVSAGSKKAMVIIGASYAKGWNVDALDGMPVINKGVGGEQTHEVLARFDRDVIAVKPRVVLIWGFINDVFRSEPEERKEKLQLTRENLRNMVDKARRNGIVPILATEVTLPGDEGVVASAMGWIGKMRGKENYRDQINSHVIEVNQWIRVLAAEQKLVLLDFERALAGKDGRRKREYTTEDGTHLSASAYEALTQYARGRKLLN
jgi:lysophospholipase L1-like esterase